MAVCHGKILDDLFPPVQTSRSSLRVSILFDKALETRWVNR